MLRVIGFDPGFRHIGWAIVSVPDRKLIVSGTISLDSQDDHDGLWSGIDNIGRMQGGGLPKFVCIEDAFQGANPRNFGYTKEVIGVIKYVLHGDSRTFIMTTPTMGNVRLGLIERGNKTDKMKRDAARALYPDAPPITTGHEASAIGAALAGWDRYCLEVLDQMDQMEETD